MVGVRVRPRDFRRLPPIFVFHNISSVCFSLAYSYVRVCSLPSAPRWGTKRGTSEGAAGGRTIDGR
jgi:hypothetical protein